MVPNQVLRAKKLINSNIINIAARHNLREVPSDVNADSRIDSTKTPLNVILSGGTHAADIAKMAKDLMEKANVKPLRKDAVRAIEIVFSLPPSFVIDIEKFFTDSLKWAEGFFEIPILSAVIHNDEAAPHCHVLMLPLFDGRMIGSRMVGYKKRLIAMQDDYHAMVGQHYGLFRGAAKVRYSRNVKKRAANLAINVLRNNPALLGDPVVCDALREILSHNPLPAIAALGLKMPEP